MTVVRRLKARPTTFLSAKKSHLDSETPDFTYEGMEYTKIAGTPPLRQWRRVQNLRLRPQLLG